MENEDELKQKLQDLQKQLGKKQLFEDAVSSIKSLLLQFYPTASPSLTKLFIAAISRVSTILKTRYTAPGFWNAGLGLFLVAERLVSESSEKEQLRRYIAIAQEQLGEAENQPEGAVQNRTSQGYLFEGHLTVDPEPPQPQWLIQSNLLTTIASMVQEESSNTNTLEDASHLHQELMERLDEIMPLILEDAPAAPRAPPTSKEVVANLPIITVTAEILGKLGPDAECAICKENLAVGDKIQELPCKHTYHPPCLKPWLDEHNSCPSCRHELRTDDHNYESWKEREKEAEEERKGAANAVRGGEFMYV